MDYSILDKVMGFFFFFLLSDNSIQSVITFDEGGEWVHLRKPENAKCDSTAKSKEKVCFFNAKMRCKLNQC